MPISRTLFHYTGTAYAKKRERCRLRPSTLFNCIAVFADTVPTKYRYRIDFKKLILTHHLYIARYLVTESLVTELWLP